MEVSVTVNGVVRSADVEARTLLVHLLRDELGPTDNNADARFRAHLARVLTERALEAATG